MTRVVAVREPIWWGAIAAIGVFASMHATVAFAAMYLAQGADAWPPPETPLPEPTVPLGVVALAIVTFAVTALGHRQVPAGRPARLQLASAVIAGLLALSVALSFGHLAALGYDHTVNAFASAYWVNVGVHTAFTVAVVIAHTVLAVRHWPPEEELRLRSGFVATVLLTYFVTVGWASVYGVLHLVPRFWTGVAA